MTVVGVEINCSSNITVKIMIICGVYLKAIS